jgi:hypothetical protein
VWMIRVPVKDLRGHGPKSAADSAAFSRAIRRLADRGLVILCNFAHGVRSGPNAGKVTISPADKHARADHLMLTELGRKVAARTAQNVITPASPAPTQRAVPRATEGCISSVTPNSAPPVRTCAFDERPAARSCKQASTRPSPPNQPAGPAPAKCQYCNLAPPGRPDCPICRYTYRDYHFPTVPRPSSQSWQGPTQACQRCPREAVWGSRFCDNCRRELRAINPSFNG